MNLDKIVTITGKPGLHKIIVETPSKFIVENLEDSKKKLSVGTNYHVAPIGKITIFTTGESEPTLTDVFAKIYKGESENPAPDFKESANQLKAFFKKVLPDYDENRVYPSDFKKIIKWYHILKKAGYAGEQNTEQ